MIASAFAERIYIEKLIKVIDDFPDKRNYLVIAVTDM